MSDPFLYDQLDGASRMGFLNRELPEHLQTSLNPKFELRPYQFEAFARFLHCGRRKQISRRPLSGTLNTCY